VNAELWLSNSKRESKEREKHIRRKEREKLETMETYELGSLLMRNNMFDSAFQGGRMNPQALPTGGGMTRP
jgi:hypothetical protein